MKTSIFFWLLGLCLLSWQCEDDCDKTYTISGTVWNGTTDRPRAFIKIEAGAGGQSNLFSGSVNAKDFEPTTTDALGFFSLKYKCVEDNWKISVTSKKVPGEVISYDIPTNKNYEGRFNIPDSVTLDLYFNKTTGLGPNDTLFVRIGIPDHQQELLFFERNQPSGFYKRYRIDFAESLSMRSSLSIIYGIGKDAYLGPKPYTADIFKNNISKREPEINTFTITY